MPQPRFRLAHSSVQAVPFRLPNFLPALCGILIAVCLLAPRSFAQDAVRLEISTPITREIRGGETHSYQITLTAGQFLRAVVEQRGVNLLVTLSGPDGQKLAELDSPVGAQGVERVSLIAETAGTYRVALRPWQPQAPKGRYEIKVEELRAATPKDKARVAAERTFAEATLLSGQGTAEATRRAIEKYRETVPRWQLLGERQQEVHTLTVIGHLFAKLGEYQQALVYYDQALPLSRDVADQFGEAMALYNAGLVYNVLGDYRKALECYDRSLAIHQALGNRSMEAAVLGNSGAVYSNLGENQKALELFQQALVLKRQVSDPYGEATVLNNIGLVLSYLGEPQQALGFYHQALPLYRALNDRSGESTTLNNIATLYSELGEYQKALEFLEQVLQLKRTTGNKVEEAIALNNIGVAYGYLGESQKALTYYNQALTLSQTAGDRSLQSTTFGNIGKAHDNLGNHHKALDFYHRALALKREIGDRRGEAATLTNMGRAFYGLQEYEKALDSFRQALQLRQRLGDRSGEAVTLFNIALAQRDRNQLAEARAQIEAALTIVETLRSKVASQGLRTSYLASVQQFYELNIDLLMRLHQQRPTEGFDAVALQTAERARARTLLELLNEARANIRQGVAPELLARERTLQQALDTKAAAQMQLLSGKHSPEQAAATAKEISALATEYEQVQGQIRHTSPRYAALTQPVPLTPKEIQSVVLDDDTLLLEYALGEERSYLWAVTPTTLQSFALPKRAEIEAAARKVYEILTARNQSPTNETPAQRRRRLDRADAAYPQAAAALSRMLLGPVASQLEAKRLVIVSDGVLQYIPFAALPKPEVRSRKSEVGSRITTSTAKPRSTANNNEQVAANYRLPTSDFRLLIADHEIITLPSASVLSVLRQETAGRNPASKSLAVLADPVFHRNDARLNSPDVSRAGESEFVRLRFSRAEAEQIASLVPTGQTLKALDFAANRETATSAELGDYRIVHFATHALVNHQHPELSGIVLSQVDEKGQPRDGFLRLHEIYNLRLAAELVVLSACETALGKEVKGEGMIGLTRGFMYAGAPRVAASLWRTDDRAAAELMKRFYQRMLGEGMTAASALRAAQVSMFQEKRWETPYYWAAFTLQGEWK